MKYNTQESGISLVETMVAMGLVGVMGVIIMNMTEMGAHQQAGIEERQGGHLLVSEIRGVLTENDACTASLGSLNPKTGTDVTAINSENGNPLYSIGKKYQSNSVEIGSMKIDNFVETNSGTDGVAELEIRIKRSKKGTVRDISKYIKVKTILDSSDQIVSCHALSALGNESSYWLQNLELDLYYNSGDVFIGYDQKKPGHPGIAASLPNIKSLELSSPSASGFNMYAHGDNKVEASNIRLLKARGSVSSPTPTKAGDSLGGLLFGGYNDDFYTRGRSGIRGKATSDYESSEGAILQFFTSPNTTSKHDTPTEVMRLTENGDLLIGRTEKQTGHPGVDSILNARGSRSLEIAGPTASGLKVTGYGSDDFEAGVITLAHAHGSVNSPEAIKSGNSLGSLVFSGHNGNHFSRGRAKIGAQATSNFSTTSEGADLLLYATPAGSSSNATPSEIMRIAGDGNVYINGSVAHSSDERLKTSISNIGDDREGALEKILKLEGKSFFWRNDEYPDMSLNKKRDIGLIAQDVEKVFPEVVSQNKGSGFKSVAYSKLIAPVIEAIKELFNKFFSFVNRVEQLEKRNKMLEQKNNKMNERLEILERKVFKEKKANE